jgi:hypothetical protein
MPRKNPRQQRELILGPSDLQHSALTTTLPQDANRNEYQEYILGCKGSWGIGLTTLPHSCANHLEITEPQPPGAL